MTITTGHVPAQRNAEDIPTARDYCGEMRRVIDEATADGAYVPRLVASEVAEKLRATDPDLLEGWLQAQAEHFLWQMINDRDRSVRAATRHRIKPQAFSEAAAAHESGDGAPLRKFLDMPFSVADGSRKPLAKLDKDDLLFVRDGYQKRADENAFWVAVTGALAKKVGKGLVEDHFTEDQLAKMFDSSR